MCFKAFSPVRVAIVRSLLMNELVITADWMKIENKFNYDYINQMTNMQERGTLSDYNKYRTEDE